LRGKKRPRRSAWATRAEPTLAPRAAASSPLTRRRRRNPPGEARAGDGGGEFLCSCSLGSRVCACLAAAGLLSIWESGAPVAGGGGLPRLGPTWIGVGSPGSGLLLEVARQAPVQLSSVAVGMSPCAGGLRLRGRHEGAFLLQIRCLQGQPLDLDSSGQGPLLTGGELTVLGQVCSIW
jgi:hypothetical protein